MRLELLELMSSLGLERLCAELAPSGRYYADLAGEETFHNNKTLIYLAGTLHM